MGDVRRLQALAKATGRSKSYYARQAILEKLEGLGLDGRRLPRRRRPGTHPQGRGARPEFCRHVAWSTWTVEYAASVRKSVRKLAPDVRKRIRRYIEERLASLDDPRQLGAALRGTQFEDLWRFRVGDYRIIARLEHARLIILVLAVAHRREVHR